MYIYIYVQYFVNSLFFAQEYSIGRGNPTSIVVSESLTFSPTFSSLDRSCLQNWSHATVQKYKKAAIRIPIIKKIMHRVGRLLNASRLRKL
jgi:hypothetical protein